MSFWYENYEPLLKEIIKKRKAALMPPGTSADWPYEKVMQFRIEGEIAYVKLVDLRNSNGLTNQMNAALKDMAMELHGRSDVKVLVMTAGGKYFCTGGAFAANDPNDAKFGPPPKPNASNYDIGHAGLTDMGEVVFMLATLPQFKICSIRGENMGAGNSIISSCDYVVAPKDNASMAFIEVKRGVASCPSWQGVLGKMGSLQSRRFTMIAGKAEPDEAHQVGLVDELSDSREASDQRAFAKAAEIAALSSEEVRALKKTGPVQQKPLLKLPAAIADLDAMQMDVPDFVEVVEEAIEATGRTGRVPEARLSKELWTNTKVKFAKKGQQVMVLTLNSPDTDNAIDAEMLNGLLDAAIELHKSAGKVRLLEIRATGDFFCSGLDKNASLDPEQLQRLLFLFYMIPMCTVCIIEGKVVGFGNAFSSVCDQVYASTSQATFNYSGVKEDKYCEFLKDRLGASALEELLTNAGKTNTTKEMADLNFTTGTFNDQMELSTSLDTLYEKVRLTTPNGVAEQKNFIAKVCTTPINTSVLDAMADHIASRQAYDTEMQESLKQIFDKDYVPLYARSQVSASPPQAMIDAIDLVD